MLFSLPLEKKHGKLAKKLFKSVRRHFYHIFRSQRRILSLKKSLLVICKILRLFFNTFTADDKYSLLNRDNLMPPIQMILSQKQKLFLMLLPQFGNQHKISNISKKRMTLIANVFAILGTLKDAVRKISKKCCFLVPFD